MLCGAYPQFSPSSPLLICRPLRTHVVFISQNPECRAASPPQLIKHTQKKLKKSPTLSLVAPWTPFYAGKKKRKEAKKVWGSDCSDLYEEKRWADKSSTPWNSAGNCKVSKQRGNRWEKKNMVSFQWWIRLLVERDQQHYFRTTDGKKTQYILLLCV